ncbi:MAG: polyphosphate kinase [Saprospiraceae bacterium]|nr:polyphosphate kinase [Saprospiraceae bacterium]
MIELSKIPTTPPEELDRDQIEEKTEELEERLGDLQRVMYAEQKHSVLVVLQGMDASGKDGAVKNVFKECHPNGISTYSFKKPTEEEFAHDFLWRVHQQAPKKGMIKVFNRSHYEDILIQRVHGWINDERRTRRMESINAFEELLQYDGNTTIFKFYLHISFEQQKIELQQRIDEEDKHWKHNDNDWKEREHWDKYMNCYEYAINNSRIPWHIIPVDKRWYRNYLIAKTIVGELEKLDMQYPPLVSDK